jgi:hypothetical protein
MLDRKLNTMRPRSRALEKWQVLPQRLRLIRVNFQQSYQVQGSTRFSTPVTRKEGDHRGTRARSRSLTARKRGFTERGKETREREREREREKRQSRKEDSPNCRLCAAFALLVLRFGLQMREREREREEIRQRDVIREQLT